MDVTFYYRADIQACVKARRILDRLRAPYKLQITEVAVKSEDTITAPAIGVAGSKLQVLDSSRGLLNEQTIQAYLELAKVSGAVKGSGVRDRGSGDDSLVSSSGATVRKFVVKSYMWKHRVAMIIAALSAFLGLAWLAPLLDSMGMRGAYSAIFSAYKIVCLQTPERSPFVAGGQCCLCWRCVAIYGGSLLFGIIYTLGRDGRLPQARMRWLTQGIGLKGLIIFSIPMFADGLSHTFGLRAGPLYAYSTDFWLGWGEFQADWLLRISTALLATVGAVKFLCTRLDKIAEGYGVGRE